MHCVQLTLVNFGNHANTEISFRDGCIAIMGANGSGKSHILNAIRYALTGVNSNAGNKADNIRNVAGAGEPSYVRLHFTHAGVDYVVRRNLRPARPTAVLVISNPSEEITGDEAVNTRIQDILGISTEVLNSIVIVAQDEVLGFVNTTPAKRAELFQALFNTQAAAAALKFLNEQLRTIIIPQPTADRDQVVMTLQSTQQQHDTIMAQLVAYPAIVQMTASRDALLQDVMAAEVIESNRANIEETRRQLEVAEQELPANAEAMRHSNQLYTLAEAEEQQQRQDTEAAKQELTIYQNACTALTEWQRHEARITTATEQLSNHTRNAVQPPVFDEAAIVTAMAKLAATIEWLQKKVELAESGMVECPTCGTTVTHLTSRIDELRAELRGYEDERQKLQSALTAGRYELQRYGQYQRLEQQYQAAVHSAIQFRKPKPDVPAVDVAAIQMRIGLLQIKQQRLNDAKQEASLAQRRHASREESIRLLRDRLMQFQAMSLQQTTLMSPEMVTAAKQQIADLAASIQTRQTIETQQAVRRQQMEMLTKQIHEIDAAIAKGVKIRSWVTVVDRVKAILARDGAPQLVAMQNLRMLVAGMNDVLGMFDAQFTVNTTDGLQFVANFNDQSTQQIERLSGGQKVVLALAFRLALNLMLASNVGALYLDEPTAWLDDYRIRNFEAVLQRLRELAAARGIQFIIITHEQGLAHLFEQVVRL